MIKTIHTGMIFLILALFGCAKESSEKGMATTIAPALQITSVSPTSSAPAGGATMTVRGTLFQSGLSIMIGASWCTPVTFVSANEATCILPAQPVGTYNVTVTNANGGSVTLVGAITYANAFGPPTITSVSPTSGSTNGNTPITITGTQFQTGATVRLDASNCTSVTVVSATSITCTTPSHAAGAVGVTVTNPDAQTHTLSSAYTYVMPPTYTSLKADVLTSRCSSCHGTSGGFSTEIHSQIVTRLSPGNPAVSLLYTRVANDSMPTSGGPLTAEQKQKIFDWIADGAPNN